MLQVGRSKIRVGKCETSGSQTFRLPALSAARRTQEPVSSSREQFRAGAGNNQERQPSGLLQVFAPGKLRLTVRSSGQINRFAIDAAA